MSKRELRALVGAKDPASPSPEPETYYEVFEKAVAATHAGGISGQAPLPLPKGCKVWHGPVTEPTEIVGR